MAKLGIDLGTSNSAAAVLFSIDKKTPVMVEPVDGAFHGDLVFPSYVAFDRLGDVAAAGLVARERYFSGESELVVRHFKRLIGRPYDYVIGRIAENDRAFSEFKGRIARAEDGLILVKTGEKNTSVNEVTAFLLGKIVKDARLLLENRAENIEALTISLPAGFDDSQRQATHQAARMAGLTDIDIQVIEEPSAAAIAEDLGGTEENVMVVDVGAGTTDVVIGRMEVTEGGLRLITTTREYDDVLGGMDMDNLILDHIMHQDTETPALSQIYAESDISQRLRLMGKIEEAKISASQHGDGVISVVLATTPSKRIRVPLDGVQLASIVAPVINGYSPKRGYRKGVRPVVEKALLNAAGGDKTGVPRVITQIDRLILIGGPCKMECMHAMLKDVFRENARIAAQLDAIDPLDKRFMEGVAQGVALSQAEGIEVTTTVPYTMSVFSQAGTRPVLGAGTPYTRGKGISRSVSVPVHEASNLLWVLSQKESQPRHEWSMRGHIINVPSEGEIEVTLIWGEGGTEADKATVEGCGLPGVIKFPQMNSTTTLGAELESHFKGYLRIFRDLRRLIQVVREPWIQGILPQVGNEKKARIMVDDWLWVPEPSILKCEAIEPDKESHLTEEEIQIALKEGAHSMRKQVVGTRGLASLRSIEVTELVLQILWTPTSVEELVVEAKRLLSAGQGCAACSPFCQQLTQWLEQLDRSQEDPAVASAAATSLGALADCLYNHKIIGEEEFARLQNVVGRFYAG